MEIKELNLRISLVINHLNITIFGSTCLYIDACYLEICPGNNIRGKHMIKFEGDGTPKSFLRRVPESDHPPDQGRS